jgi:hypothetical protein
MSRKETTMLTSPKNVLLSNVTLNWARLDTPAENPFGGAPSWEVQAIFPDAAAAKVAEEAGITVKEKDGQMTASLRRKSVTKDGADMEPVRVVDGTKAPMDSTARRKIGNGSKGNLIVWCAPYDYRGRKGVTASLTAVQVTELVEYSGGGDSVDFDMVETANAPEASADLF